ncbi:Putative esterase [Granulicella rosea]|uniref:Putative esterase n=1 Tax=Granulicella rosea TaxID=474952 RepID=A0A239KS76_9BACT|nr:alpha/beta hydrolase-fold protein [Granulicella rosea]SNT20528.1 Putative esterase [Granulicella rosea]
MRPVSLLSLFSGLLLCASALAQTQPAHVFFKVTLAASASAPLDGRVLVFVKAGKGDTSVDVDEFHPADVWVTAKEVRHLAPGASVEIDGADLAFPQSFAAMPAGDYEAQAVLDTDHTYNYANRGSSNWIGPVVQLGHWSPAAAEPVLTLDHRAVEDPARTAAIARAKSSVQPGVVEEYIFASPLLTRFSGNATVIRSWIALPPGYAAHPAERYPTVYATHGFGGSHESNLNAAIRMSKMMAEGSLPPMIWVMLDESCPGGTHEFADSVNNGPWGAALTTEFIPAIEAKYRMDAKPTGRLLNGHSSGGWATLQLQINYPHVFGGTWSTSPDSSDFHDFTGPNLYAPHANVYRKPDGSAWPIMRIDGKVAATIQQFAQLERVLGPYGGQFTSFDWVFSPRSDGGEPKPMFDRMTGDVDPAVVAYWGEHYDLANIVERTWPERGAMLKGRIHLTVGTADTFYLDGAAHRLDARLSALGADAHFVYLPGRSHFDLYTVDKDRYGLYRQIGAEMYAVARPGVDWKQGK